MDIWKKNGKPKWKTAPRLEMGQNGPKMDFRRRFSHFFSIFIPALAVSSCGLLFHFSPFPALRPVYIPYRPNMMHMFWGGGFLCSWAGGTGPRGAVAFHWKRGKDPHPHTFSFAKKTARFTKGRFRHPRKIHPGISDKSPRISTEPFSWFWQCKCSMCCIFACPEAPHLRQTIEVPGLDL